MLLHSRITDLNNQLFIKPDKDTLISFRYVGTGRPIKHIGQGVPGTRPTYLFFVIYVIFVNTHINEEIRFDNYGGYVTYYAPVF